MLCDVVCYRSLRKVDFEPLELIGRGAFGEVVLVRLKDSSSISVSALGGGGGDAKGNRVFGTLLVRCLHRVG